MVRHLRGELGPADGMWEKLIDGEIFRSEPHQNGDLAALPFPDYEIFSRDGSFEGVNSSIFGPKGRLVLPVMTGRLPLPDAPIGCNTPLLESWKAKRPSWQVRTEAMVDELERLRDKYNVGYFEFWDELFLSNLKFVRAFFEIYKERIRLPFSINSRVEVMNEDFCRTAAEAGCHTIWFGIESGDEEFRSKMLGRKMKNQQVIDAADNCKKAGIFRLTSISSAPRRNAAGCANPGTQQRIAAEFFFSPYNRCAHAAVNSPRRKACAQAQEKPAPSRR